MTVMGQKRRLGSWPVTSGPPDKRTILQLTRTSHSGQGPSCEMSQV